MDIETLVKWSEPKEVQTKYGPRMLRKAEATASFWDVWRKSKDELKKAGVGCSRDERSGEWQALWWQELPDEIKTQRDESVAQSKATSAEIELPHPEGLDYMPFQKAGIRFALGRKGVLFGDEMGLGKTIQAIGVINADETIDSAIIICPLSLKLNWLRECEKWIVRDLSVGVVNGGWPDTDIVILNYEGVKKYKAQIQARTWGACIVDEVHYIKNYKTQRSAYIKGNGKDIEPIKAGKHLRLTGTPIVNRPVELYNIISDLGGSWGSFFTFAKRYANATHNGFGWDFSGASNLDELQRRLRETIMVRRLKADVLTELPAKIRQVIELEPDKSDQNKAVKSEIEFEKQSEERLAELRVQVELAKAESEEAYQQAVECLRDASQVDFTEMSRLRHETAVAKIPLVIDFVRALFDDDDEKKVIIAAHHRDVIDGLANGLIDFYPVALTGGMGEKERQESVDRFQNEKRTRVFIGSIQAAGVGITLTASSHVIFAELDWVPGNVSQMEDRAHRIGQQEIVLVQHLVISGSIDARMAKTIVDKQRVIDSALDKDHPERKAPVFEPREAAATKDTKPDVLAGIADKITDGQVLVVHSGLRMLAGLDADRASVINEMGFNRLDGRIGHELANLPQLTKRQAALGAKLLKKYHRQLPDEINQAVEEALNG